MTKLIFGMLQMHRPMVRTTVFLPKGRAPVVEFDGRLGGTQDLQNTTPGL
jgi:hypothetical protein